MPEQIDIAVVASDLSSGVFRTIGQAMTGLISPGEAVSAVLQTVGQFVKEATDGFVDYASEVRNVMQLSGQTAEESSRVIQVLDDYKVKTESLSMAQKSLAKEGLSLTIDTLADLSDEYKSLGNNADKTSFLVKNFGRSGLQMAEAMEQGGKAIRDASSAVEDGLIVTQKGIAQAREYERQVDNLNDAWSAFTMSIGRVVVPALTSLITSETNWQAAQSEAGKHTDLSRIAIQELAVKIYEQKQAQTAATQATREASDAMKDGGLSAEQLAEKEKIAADAAKSMTDANNTLLGTIGSMQSAEDTYQSNGKKLLEERAKLEAEKATLRAQGWGETSQKIKDVDAALQNNTLELQKNADEYTKQGNKIVWDLVKTMFMADGTLSDQETQWLLDNGVAMGQFSEDTAKAAKGAIAEAQKISDAIQAIPDKTVNITVVTNSVAGYNQDLLSGKGHATGGSFMIPSSYGNEGFRMGNGDTASGGELVTITPRGGARGGGNISLSLNIASGMIQDPQEVGRQMVPALKYALREIGIVA
jgi:hypothetical protein